MIFSWRSIFSRSIKTFSSRFETIKLKRHYDMKTVLNISDDSVNYAVKLLSEGEIIALPTDTVYGVAADCLNSDAVSRLYEVKGRNFRKPVAICVGDVDDIQIWGKVDDIPLSLLKELLPGPVTILLKRTKHLNRDLNPGTDKVGIRIPKSDFVCKVASCLGSALALTSANSSNEPSTLSPSEFKPLWSHLGAVFSAGKLGDNEESRSGSTIVDLTVPGKFTITRDGSALKSTLMILSKYGLEQIN